MIVGCVLTLLLVIPLVTCGIKQSSISNRCLLAMIKELRAEGYAFSEEERVRLSGLWLFHRKSILQLESSEDFQEIAARHIAECEADSWTWKLAALLWILAVTGVMLWFSFRR